MEDKKKFQPDRKLKLMDQARQVLRYYHYSYRTEKTYGNWIIRFLKFYHLKIHPREMGKNEIEAYLSYLATKENVSASTQKQAMNSILFLYREVLGIPIEEVISPVKSKKPRHLQMVMTHDEVKMVLVNLHGTHLIMAKLFYGSGLRLMECVRLRVQDLDINRNIIYVRAAKGNKDRTTLFPSSLKDDLRRQLAYVKQLHDKDLAEGYGETLLPTALSRKYPGAVGEFRWQYVFPSKKLSLDPRTDLLVVTMLWNQDFKKL